MATSLADIVQARAQAAAKSQEALAKESGNVAQANVASVEKMIEGINRVSQAEEAIAMETLGFKQRLQDSKARLYQATGGEDALVRGAEEVVKGGETIKAKVAEVQRKKNRSIFDLVSDPIGTITDVVTLSKSQGELEAAVATTGAALSATEQRHKVLTQGNQEIEQFATVTSAAMVKHTQDKFRGLRDSEAAKAEIEARRFGLQEIAAVATADLNIVQLASTAQNAKDAEIRIKLALDNAALERQRFQFAKDQAAKQEQIRQAAIKEGRDELAYLSGNIIAGMKVAGIEPPKDETALRIMAKTAVSNPNSPAAHYLSMGMMNGGGKTNVIATSAADYLRTTERVDIKLPPTMDGVRKILDDAKLLMQEDKNTKGLNRKTDPEAWDAEYNKKVSELVNGQFNQVIPGSGSIADFGAKIPSFIKAAPDLQVLPVTKKFLDPFIATGGSMEKPVDVLRAGVAFVREGKLTSDEFIKGMSAIYAKSAQLNVAATRMNDIGIVPTAVGRTYNVNLNESRFGNKLYNLTNPTDWSTIVAKELSRNPLATALTSSGWR